MLDYLETIRLISCERAKERQGKANMSHCVTLQQDYKASNPLAVNKEDFIGICFICLKSTLTYGIHTKHFRDDYMTTNQEGITENLMVFNGLQSLSRHHRTRKVQTCCHVTMLCICFCQFSSSYYLKISSFIYTLMCKETIHIVTKQKCNTLLHTHPNPKVYTYLGKLFLSMMCSFKSYLLNTFWWVIAVQCFDCIAL